MSAHNTISIHAPCGGSDITTTLTTLQEKKFQSTLPVGGATLTPPPSASTPAYFNPRSPWGERPGNIWFCCVELPISIHAPRGGSDGSGPGAAADHERFQSTLPVGGATHGGLRLREVQGISIHAPRGGSDGMVRRVFDSHLISIHAPRGGSDQAVMRSCLGPSDFNPRSPWGERPIRSYLREVAFTFQSTLPVGGATV